MKRAVRGAWTLKDTQKDRLYTECVQEAPLTKEVEALFVDKGIARSIYIDQILHMPVIIQWLKSKKR